MNGATLERIITCTSIDMLTLREKLTLIYWWDWFDRKRLDRFFTNLDRGMHARAAYNDAKQKQL